MRTRILLAALLLPAPVLAGEATLLTTIGSYSPTARSTPSGGLVSDGNGGVIGVDRGGTTERPGGAVLDFTPPAVAGNPGTVTLLYAFAGGTDGAYPQGELLRDGTGGFYGTTFKGGTAGVGTAYHLAPPATPRGAWTHTILYNFQGGSADAAGPQGQLQVDSTGNLIGVSNGNGASGAGQSGAIYRLTPPATAGGAWTEQVLALFVGPPEQGHAPQSLVLDPTGVIYAALLSGGTDNNGQIVQLAPPASGTGLWTTTVLLNFTRGKGAAGGVYPNWITETAPGTLTGTTGGGGANKAGTFFRLSNSTGTWAETVLYSFGATPTDATHPNGHLYTDTDGSLLGTAAGGAHAEGTIFRLSQSGGVYANTVLYSFSGGATGNGPKSALISNGNGAFFGNTFGGGTMNRGTVYVFTP